MLYGKARVVEPRAVCKFHAICHWPAHARGRTGTALLHGKLRQAAAVAAAVVAARELANFAVSTVASRRTARGAREPSPLVPAGRRGGGTAGNFAELLVLKR